MSYYILIDETASAHGEYGYLYREAFSNIIVPEGFVIVKDDTRTYEHIEVIRKDALFEIPYETYSHLETMINDDQDVTEQIPAIIRQQEERIKKLRVKREQFVTLASELLEVWQGVPYKEGEHAGMDTNYPFEQDFAEVVAKMMQWGYTE